MVVLGSVLLAIVLLLLGSAEYILHHAEPILRRRITETLAARFQAPVTLDALSISLFRGIEVSGSGLRIGYGPGMLPVSPSRPMLSVEHFAFRTGLRAFVGDTLAHRPLHIADVRIEGLDLHIPPSPDRNRRQRAGQIREPEKYVVVVDRLKCRNVRLFIESARPASGPASEQSGENGRKPPIVFDISALTLQNVGKHQAMLYDAQLVNAKPVGVIHAYGHFGPWADDKFLDTPSADADPQPGNTPLDGDYTFDHADLGTIKGIAGTLSSTGRFAGILDRIAIDGRTDTPNFSLGLADRSLPLHTDFHAVVDGTSGDTYLQPVHALLGGSAFTTSGKVVKIKGQGHDIQLDVAIPHGRMQDFLRLAVRTEPPLLNGILAMKAKLHIPPGNAAVAQKMSLAGSFTLTQVRFNNPRWQNRIDNLSARAEGHPELAEVGRVNRPADIPSHTPSHISSQLAAGFMLEHGVLSVSDMHYAIPGALVLMNGVYSTDGKLFEFKGHVRTNATASAMVGGWKGLLLSPLDHLLEKNGAGLELPVEISGTGGDLHFGLALKGADDQPAQLLADVRGKAQAKQDLSKGRTLLTEADAQDQLAAKAPTLEEAQRAHNAAVRLRAEAQAKAQAAERTTGSKP